MFQALLGKIMWDEQKEIGNKLLEIYDKNIDRLYSVVQFAIAVLGLYAAVFALKADEIIAALKVINWDLILCIISLLLSIAFSILKMEFSHNYTMFEENNGLIQFKNDVSKQNQYLFSETKSQYDIFRSSLTLILCSLGFGYSYLIQSQPVYPELKTAINIIVWVLFGIGIYIKYRRWICNLVR